MKRFLGRIYDEKTMTWTFTDGSGIPITEEFRKDFVNTIKEQCGGVKAIGKLFEYKDKMAKQIKNNPLII